MCLSPLLYFMPERSSLMNENRFQAKLIKEIKERLPGCIIMKNDASYIQGIPDILVLYNDRWASLECKKSEEAGHQPNQDYYVEKMNSMSFSAFIFPENKEDVLDAMARSLTSGPRRRTRVLRSK